MHISIHKVHKIPQSACYGKKEEENHTHTPPAKPCTEQQCYHALATPQLPEFPSSTFPAAIYS
jgi:hypothetical protein